MRRQRLLVNSAIVLAVILPGALYQAYTLWQSHRFYESKTVERVQSLARLVQGHATARIERADAVLREVGDYLQGQDMAQPASASPWRLHALRGVLAERQRRYAWVDVVMVTDENGQVFASTGDAKPDISIAQTPYFQDMQAHTGDAPYVSPAVKDPISGAWSLLVSRRLLRANGDFAGVMVASLGLRHNFERFYATVGVEGRDLITLRDAHNRILVRYPVQNELLGTPIRGSTDVGRILAQASEDSFVTRSPLDGVVRVAAVRKLPQQDVFVAIGLDRNQAMMPWHKDLQLALFMALVALVVGPVLVYVLYRRDRMLEELALVSFALDKVEEAAYLADAQGHLRYVNDEVCRRLGQSRQALLRLRVTDVAGLWSTPQQWAVLWDQLALQTSMSLECLHRRQDGTEFPVEVQACRFVFLGRTYVLCLVRDITQRKQADEHIRQLAFYDHLTGLANRRLLRDRLQHSLNSRRRQARPGALMMLDLDHFKQLNDTLGHDVGDQFLIEVARRLQACVRDADTVARLGGDEFVVMLENLNEDGDAATQAQGVARKILHTLAQVHELNLSPPGEAPRTHRYLGTASLGIALFHDSTLSVDELLKRADVAMYHAKSAGRNTFCFFEGEARVQPPTAGA